MKIIGLTGGIGTGKSTVSAYLKKQGIEVIDADKIAHDIVAVGEPALREIAAAFGHGILNVDGSLNRKALSSIVFNQPTEREKLEAITSNRIITIIENRIEALRDNADMADYSDVQMVVIDAPLLFESGLNRLCDEVWVVDAEREVRIQRAIERDKTGREEIVARINSQIDADEALAKADHIITNSGTLSALYKQIDNLLKEYA
ncbi:MAG: dephospho-CoA kinase [Firmicutes bacterium]|nr:dephospho-CoA kinase [Bacillota bacterium]